MSADAGEVERDSSAVRKRPTQRLPGSLDAADRKLLLAQPSRRYPSSIRNRVIMATMLLAGLRCTEVLTLKPRDVKFQDGTIKVMGKGRKERVVPIAGSLEGHLREWAKLRPAGPTFFGTLAGAPLHPSYIRRMVKRYGQKAGIEQDVHPHLLRHTCATAWLNEEPRISVREVQFLLGHSRLATTERYLHANPVEIANKLRRR